MSAPDAQGAIEAPPKPGVIPGWLELVAALLFAATIMLGPMIYIQHEYELFISEHGGIKEGAAGATLVLAVIMRTVTRSLLRTAVRAGARAGLKVTTKRLVQIWLRFASRIFLSQVFARFFGEKNRIFLSQVFARFFGEKKERSQDPAEIARSNLKSLGFASVLLYASWVIVLGFGQPFASLLSEEDAVAAEAAQIAELKQLQQDLVARVPPEVQAFHKEAALRERRSEVIVLRDRVRAGERDLEKELLMAEVELGNANAVFAEALALAKGRIVPPEPAQVVEAVEVPNIAVRAPFPGKAPWSSLLIWVGAALAVLPMWLIYLVQSTTARRLGRVLRHETGIDGGIIQLYFAGAASFMPLTSDVELEGSDKEKAIVSLVGLLVPTAVALVIWGIWRALGNPWILFVADLFLIYPMVQVFPLKPLDGSDVWAWSRWVWLLVFSGVMGAFMFLGSEALKNVI